MRAPLLLAVLSLLLAGCATPERTGTAPGPDEGRALSFTPMDECGSTQASELNTVVQGQQEWEQLWERSCRGGPLDAEDQPPPEVDFARSSVVASFWGEKSTGGYSVRILAITEMDDHVLIEVERAAPPPTCPVIQVLTYPHAMARSEKLTKAARFSFQDIVTEC